MSIQEKVGLAQQMFMDKTAKYAGNYAKENDTLAGSINTTKKAFQDFMATGNVTGFINSLVSTIKIAVPQIIALLPKLVDGISQILQAVVPAIAAALPTLIPALINAVVQLMNAIVAAMPTIIAALLLALPLLIQGFIQLFLAIIQALPEIITMITNALPTIIDAIVTGLTNPEALTAIIMGSIQLLMALIQAIPVVITALVKALPTIIQNIVTTLTSPQFISALMGAGVQFMKAMITGVVNMYGAIGGAIGKIVDIIKTTLSPSNLGRIGGDMIKGLWNGISDLAGWIAGKIKGFGEGILNGIKDFFGIHSPSTVFAGVGENLGLGLARGLGDSAGVVSGAVDKMANEALDALNKPLIGADMAFSGANGALSGNNRQNSTTQTVTIGTVALGDSSAVKEFFKQLNQDTINVGMGLTPIQGAQ
jgi:phage-related protein